MNRPLSAGSQERRYASTAQVARALGVSVTTVKRWVDDGVLPAHRTIGGHRKLILDDVLRLVREGDLPQADLSQIDPISTSMARLDTGLLRERLTQSLLSGDESTVRSILHGAYHQGVKIEELADAVIAPAMRQIGHQWESGVIEVHHEHRGTQLCTSALYELKFQLEKNNQGVRPVALGGCPEHDHYMLASLLAQMALIDLGWEAINLGAHTPMASFEAAIKEFRPRLLWLSINFVTNADEFVAEYTKLYSLAQKMNVAVSIGGNGLCPELRTRLPYTSYGDGLRQFVAFARNLDSSASGPTPTDAHGSQN